jgi:Tol biopolymer transport system component
VCVMRADGTHVQPVFFPPLRERDSAPAWSPDGKSIAFVRSGADLGNTDHSGVWSIRVNGGKPKLVTRGVPGNQYEPAWSPDGQWIAFTQARGTRPSRIEKIRVDGTGLTELTRGPASDRMADWSPDGTRLVFVRWRQSTAPTPMPSALWLVDSAGTAARPLTGTVGTADAPAWSPDGKLIAFESARKPSGSIFTMEIATGRVVRLVTHVAGAGRIAWQPLR